MRDPLIVAVLLLDLLIAGLLVAISVPAVPVQLDQLTESAATCLTDRGYSGDPTDEVEQLTVSYADLRVCTFQ